MELYNFRQSQKKDGQAVWEFIKEHGGLDLNSLYAYYLLCKEFSDSSVVLYHENGNDEELIGFVLGFLKPTSPHTFFIWQISVHPDFRGRKIAERMLDNILSRPSQSQAIDFIQATINPSNQAVKNFFENFAQQHDAPLVYEDYLTADDFASSEHEAEIAVTIGPLNSDLKQESLEALNNHSEN